MNKNQLKYIIVFLVVFLAKSSFASDLPKTSQLNEPRLFAITPSLVSNSDAKILIILPVRSANFYSYEIFLPWQTTKPNRFILGEKPQEIVKTFHIDSPGKYSVILIGYSDKEHVNYVATEQIEATNGFLTTLILNWGGTIVGAFLAVLIFIIQDMLKYLLNRIKSKKEFMNMALNFIEYVKTYEFNDLSQVEYPAWLVKFSNSEWNIHNHEPKLMEIINDLISLTKELKESSISQNELYQKLNAIKAKIKLA